MIWVNATPSLAIGFPQGFLNGITTSYTPSFMDIMAQGGLTYVTSSSGHQVYAYSTCNQVQKQVLAATGPTLIKAIPNGTGAVAVDPPSVDVISTPSPLSAGCPVTTPEQSQQLRPWRRQLYTGAIAGHHRQLNRVGHQQPLQPARL